MISKSSTRFCSDDITLIENYAEALSDEQTIWHLHHRLETEMGLKRDELIEMGLYYNRPSSELIFLTPSEHISLHNTGEGNGMYGVPRKSNVSPMLGKPHSEETKRKISKTRKERGIGRGKDNYQWKDICPLQLYVDRKVFNMNFEALAEKYDCGFATIYRRLKQYNIH